MFANKNFQIVQNLSEICKKYSQNQSINYVCYTDWSQDGDIDAFLEDLGRTKWIVVTDEILSQGIEAASVMYIDMAPEVEKQLGVGENPNFVPPRYDLNISKNLISRAVVELVLIMAYRTRETMLGHDFSFDSFKIIEDLELISFIQIVCDFVLEEHLSEPK